MPTVCEKSPSALLQSYLPVYMETSTGYADPKITIDLDI